MIRLHQTFGVHTGRLYEFAQPSIRIGRMPDSDVAFDAHTDLDASGRHAEIHLTGTGWVLRDQNSRNGTFVNGNRVHEHILVHGDEIEFGPGGPRLRVDLESNSEGSPKTIEGVIHPFAQTRPTDLPQGGGGQYATAPMEAPAGMPPAHDPLPPSNFPPPMGGQGGFRPPAQGPSGFPPAPGAGGFSASPSGFPPPQRNAPGRQSPPTMEHRNAPNVSPPTMAANAITDEPKSRTGLWLSLIGITAVLIALGVGGWLWLGQSSGSGTPDPEQISTNNIGAILHIDVELNGETETICTGFAVRPTLLATSASCIMRLEAKRAEGATLHAQGTGTRLTLARLWRHPEFVPSPAGANGLNESVNVGLAEVTTQLTRLVSLAPLARVQGQTQGSTLAAYGYTQLTPGVTLTPIQNISRTPSATFFHFDQPIPLGAPVFDASGAVVGIHTTADVNGTAPSAGPGRATGTDALLALLAGMPTG